ncbi:MAG: hypothetical protein Q4A21_02215 [bacterium]|nr:hypothetical protein [bacterium]
MKYIIFDIDGVLADCSHRLKYIQGDKKDYDKFYSYDEVWKDEVIEKGYRIFSDLEEVSEEIIFITGRNESCYHATRKWLDEKLLARYCKLFMRPSNDWRPAHEVKEDLIKKYIGFKNILFAFDDDDKINEMYAKHGVMCYKPNIINHKHNK